MMRLNKMKNKNYSILLTGFKNKRQAEEFLNWYSNSGEQDFGNYLDIVNEQDNIGARFMPLYQISKWKEGVLTANLEIVN